MHRIVPLLSSLVFSASIAFGAEGQAPTFAGEVKPLLARHCSECHHPGHLLDLTAFPFLPGTAPKRVLEIVREGDMPPKPRDGLSEAEIALLAAWVEAGAPP